MTHRIVLPAALALALGALLTAQSTQSITLSQPAQPATVKVLLFRGTIAVRTGAAGAVTVATTPGPGQKGPLPQAPAAAPPGMHLISSGGAVSATENKNVVTINGPMMGGSDVNATITVPASSTLDLHTMKGDITVTGVSGDISAQAVNGNITLNQVAGSIVAHALHGKITAAVTQLGSKPSSFSSLNGDIDVTLPADAHANLRLQDDRGGIYLDDGFNFVRTADTGTTSITGRPKPLPPMPPMPPAPPSAGGNIAALNSQMDMLNSQMDMFKAGASRMCAGSSCGFTTGTLNGGGVELRFQDFRGNIYLHKGK